MLTDEQIAEIASENTGTCEYASRYFLRSNTFARAIEAAACAERDKLLYSQQEHIAELERQLENEKKHSKNMTQDRDLWMLTASERGHQLEEARDAFLWIKTMAGKPEHVWKRAKSAVEAIDAAMKGAP